MKTEAGWKLEDVISEYEVKLFTLAMHLTSDEVAAANVVEEAFVRLSREGSEVPRDQLEQHLHRYTYDVALSSLVKRAAEELAIKKSGEQADEKEAEEAADSSETAAEELVES